ncbi:25 kDa ookinete surface antigen-like [Mytilus edulis]|uniref:25 kDa ookinete surface antigen-like n=1 Tax=Mytilus edulis TaxID=6550 RepID=UPI0039F0FA5D
MCKEKANGAECTESYQCTDTQAECVNHLCTCKDGLFEDTNNANTCKEKYELGSTCSREILDQCADANAECRVNAFDTYTCLCKTTHYNKGNKCVPRIVENGECEHGGNEKQCLDKMVCKKVDGVYKCQYANESALGSSCTASTISDGSIDQCMVHDAECREDIDGIIKCLCKTTYYQSSNDDCIPSM